MTPEQKKHYWAIAEANEDINLMRMVIYGAEPDMMDRYIQAQKLLDKLYVDRA